MNRGGATIKSTNYYYDLHTGELIGTTNEVKAKLKTANTTIFKYRAQIEASHNYTLDVRRLMAERKTEITEVVDEDGEFLASSVRELANLLGIDYTAVYSRLDEIPDAPTYRRVYKDPDLDDIGLNWKYKIYDVSGKHLCDDVEKLCDLTGIKLDQIYYHLRERVKGRDDEWVFYPNEIE